MSDSKKYYYLKIAENFFEREEMIILETMPDGHLYSNILMKLYLRSLKDDGRLMYKDRIPYNSTILANITRMQVGTIEKALNIFKQLGLIEILDNGAIYMIDIQNFIGQSSTEADRIRQYRKRMESEKGVTNVQEGSVQMYDKCTPEYRDKSIEYRDKSIEEDVSKDTSVNKFTPIIDKWNSLNLQQLRTISNNRQALLNARIKEYGFDAVIEAIGNIKESSFLKGQNNKNWIITFDWLIKPNNFVKVLENNYKDNGDKQNIINKEHNYRAKKKTRFHNFDESFTKYSPDEMEQIIQKSQREKFK